jgi:hypothetical protein
MTGSSARIMGRPGGEVLIGDLKRSDKQPGGAICAEARASAPRCRRAHGVERRFHRQNPAGAAPRRLRQGIGAGLGRLRVPPGTRQTNCVRHREIDRVRILSTGRNRHIASESRGGKEMAWHYLQGFLECGGRGIATALTLVERFKRVQRVCDAFAAYI